MGMQIVSPRGIRLSLFRLVMLATIQLYGKPNFRTVEIGDIRTDAVLSEELQP